MFEIEIILLNVDDTDSNDTFDEAGNEVVINGAAVQINEMLTNGRVGSLVDSTRVSTNVVELDGDNGGGEHMTLIAIVNVDDIEIGSTGDEIENHDP